MTSESDFTGSTVLVTLVSPPNARIRGTVLSIENHMLFLSDVCWEASGRRTASFQVSNTNLADLEVLADEKHSLQNDHPQLPPKIHRDSISPQQIEANESFPNSLRGSFSKIPDIASSTAFEAPTSQPLPTPQAFVDPAILSVGKMPSKPANVSKPRSPKQERPSVPRQMLVDAPRMSPKRATPSMPVPQAAQYAKDMRNRVAARQMFRTDSMVTATLSEPFDDLSIERSHGEESEAAELGTDGGKQHLMREPGLAAGAMRQGTKTRRRGGRSKAGKNGAEQVLPALPPHVEEADSFPLAPKKQSGAARRKAARQQTPLVEADSLGIESTAATRKPKQKSKQPTRQERTKGLEVYSGWATEDATDIQELGEFDFAGNLSKFDKREIFRQLKEDDTVAAGDRLVGHNRLPKAGTSGGKNLHWTENVLDPPHGVSNGANKWNSEAGESENDISEAMIGSERSSRRALSRASIFRTTSRKSSGRADSIMEPKLVTASLNSVRPHLLYTVTSPKAKRTLSTSPLPGKSLSSRPSIRLLDSNKLCQSLSPLQMLEFEQFAITELGLSEDILAENAGRGVAEAIVRTYHQRVDSSSPTKVPIVIAVGNHRSGARALAAARHLHIHGFRVTATIMDRDESDFLDTVKQQGNAFRKAGGFFSKPASLLAALKGGSLVPGVLVEALLGVHGRFEDIRGEEQAWYFEMVMLARRQEWDVVCVDVPSGVDAVNGEFTQTDPPSVHPLTFQPSTIVSLCAPKPYLAPMLQEATKEDEQPVLYVVDIGISNVVWKRLGNRRGKGIEWGGRWIKEMGLAGAEHQQDTRRREGS